MHTVKTKQISLVLYTAIFVAMLGMGVIAPIMPLYSAMLGATGLSLGLIYSMFSVSRAIFMPMTGRLSDHFDRRIFIIIGLTMYSMASIGYIWSSTVLEMIWIRLIHGIGSAMIIPIAAAVIGDISPDGKEGRMMGQFQLALFLGFGMGPLLGGIIRDALGMNAVFLLMGGMSFISLMLIVFFFPAVQDTRQSKKLSVSSFSVLIKEKLFKALLLFRFSNAISRGVMIAFLPIAADGLSINASQIGLLISFNILVTAGFQSAFGYLADRYSRSCLVFVGSLVGGVPLFFVPFAHGFVQLLILSFLMGLGGGIAFPAAGAMATSIGRVHGMGNIMGLFNTSMSFGQIIGPIFAGWTLDLFGLKYVFILIGVLGIIGSMMFAWLVKDEEVNFRASTIK